MKPVAISLLLVTALAIRTTAQVRPDFSGTWTFKSTDKPSLALGGVVGGGTEMRILQDTTTIKIDRQYGRQRDLDANRWTFTIKLDGSPSPHSGHILLVRPGLTKTAQSTATWSGVSLVILTTTTVRSDDGKQPVTQHTVREKLSLDRTALQVERSENGKPDEHETYWRKQAPAPAHLVLFSHFSK